MNAVAVRLHPVYCRTPRCRKNPLVNPHANSLGATDGTRARMYCGGCRQWTDWAAIPLDNLISNG